MPKICTKCGISCADEMIMCPNCGTYLGNSQANGYQQNGQQYTSQSNDGMYGDAPNYGQQQNYNQQPYYGQQPMYGQQPYGNQMPMKWFHFIIYFQLFANMVLNICFGISYLTGEIYTALFEWEEGFIEWFYNYFEEMKVVDIIYGLILLVLAILALVARSQLAKFKRTGPSKYYAVLGLNLVFSVLWLILFIAIIGVDTDVEEIQTLIVSTASSIITSLIMLFASIAYFNKRSHLFVN